MIGTALGRYRILNPLGRGGMGRIFLAEDPTLGRRLAIKVLPEDVTDPLRRDRLLKDDAGYWEYGPLMWLLTGHPEEASKLERSARAYSEVDMDGAEEFAAYCARRGNRDEAFRYLDRATMLGNDSLTIYEKSPLFDPLRDDPRWKPFLDGVRERVAAFRREFSWPPPRT